MEADAHRCSGTQAQALWQPKEEPWIRPHQLSTSGLHQLFCQHKLEGTDVGPHGSTQRLGSGIEGHSRSHHCSAPPPQFHPPRSPGNNTLPEAVLLTTHWFQVGFSGCCSLLLGLPLTPSGRSDLEQLHNIGTGRKGLQVALSITGSVKNFQTTFCIMFGDVAQLQSNVFCAECPRFNP